MCRDARKLLPRSLAKLMAERETRVLDEARRLRPELTQALAADLPSGTIRPETLALCDAEVERVEELLREGRLTEGLVRLGGLVRIPADLSDPVLSVGAEGYPAGVAREYYAFLELNLPKIPLVLEDESALKLTRRQLPSYWQSMLDRGRERSALVGTELMKRGRIVDHKTLDYRSPVYGVASLAYSRAVTGIAATWLAVWRDAHGDLTRMPRPTEVKPHDAGPTGP
jgi:hypothetical protein